LGAFIVDFAVLMRNALLVSAERKPAASGIG
jgi:hypothetical protein